MPPKKNAPGRTRRSSRAVRGMRPAVMVGVVVLVGALGAIAYTWRSTLTSAIDSGSGSGQALDPSAFADGACVAFSPTAGDRGKTVFLDAGHGGIDPGGVGRTASGSTVDEGTETLPVELDAMALLRADGYRVVVSRTQNTTVVRPGPADLNGNELSLQGAHDDVAARARCANDAKADVLVGIYFDAGGSPSDAGSLTAYDAVRPFSAESLRLADLVQSDVLAEMNAQGWGIPDDGVQTDGSLGSLNGNPTSGGSPPRPPPTGT